MLRVTEKKEKEVFKPTLVTEITECASQRMKKWQHGGSEDYLINSLPVFAKVTELKALKSLPQKRAGIMFFNYGVADRVTHYSVSLKILMTVCNTYP